MKKRRHSLFSFTCSRHRKLSHAMLAAGFFLLMLSQGLQANEMAAILSCTIGLSLFAVGFLWRLLFYRCPVCRSYLILCTRGAQKECPVCGARLD